MEDYDSIEIIIKLFYILNIFISNKLKDLSKYIGLLEDK